MCLDTAVQVVGKRLKKQDISPQDMESFLNSPPPPNEGSRGDIQSLWSIVRKSLHRLRILVSVTDSNSIELDLSGSTITAIRRKLLSKLVRKEVQNLRLEELISHQDQGRTFPLVSKSPASNHWVGTGHHVTFADHRFGIRARTNLLPVKSVLKRMRKTTVDTCPKCKQQPETLGHVLNSCPANAGLMCERHNLILKRLSNATRSENGTKFLDQKIPNSPGCLRPDLVITTAHSITIVDVTIPFEASQDAFTKARSEKTQKYSELVQWARSKYSTVSFGVVIVGSLGAWDIENESTLELLGIGRRYRTLFRKLCCVDAIKGSRAIWHTKSQRT